MDLNPVRKVVQGITKVFSDEARAAAAEARRNKGKLNADQQATFDKETTEDELTSNEASFDNYIQDSFHGSFKERDIKVDKEKGEVRFKAEIYDEELSETFDSEGTVRPDVSGKGWTVTEKDGTTFKRGSLHDALLTGMFGGETSH